MTDAIDRMEPGAFAASVAGEEDPGASVELPADNAAVQAPARPGDEAPAGTPGTGEVQCPVCGGSGCAASGPCAECSGTGRVTRGVGGG